MNSFCGVKAVINRKMANISSYFLNKFVSLFILLQFG